MDFVRKVQMKKQQFYTYEAATILAGFELPSDVNIIDPFAGDGQLLNWIGRGIGYDIDPKRPDIIQRDTLLNPPDYTHTWILTNPPYLARNKSAYKALFDTYNTNDLYKCFIHSCMGANTCLGGIFILPAGFFLSPRDIDVRCRNAFMTQYQIQHVNYFEEPVFKDTPSAIVAILFIRSDIGLTEQNVSWTRFPANETTTFCMKQDVDWIIGGEIYKLRSDTIQVKRYIQGGDMTGITHMTLNALDGRTSTIALNFKKGYVYPAKDCSRTFATIRILGEELTDSEQEDLCRRFNAFLNEKRQATWSLCFPHYREYARKRIPFDLAYSIIRYLFATRENNQRL